MIGDKPNYNINLPIVHSKKINVDNSSQTIRHLWSKKGDVLAEVEVDLNTRKINVISLSVDDLTLPKLTKSISQILYKSMGYSSKEKLPPLEQLFAKAPDKLIFKKMVQEWLKCGGDPHAVYQGNSLINRCFDYDDLELLESFIKAGVNLNGYFEVSVNEKKSYELTLPHLAVMNNRKDIIEFLINKNANINQEVTIPLMEGQKNSSTQSTPLAFAIEKGEIEIVKLLYHAIEKPDLDRYLSIAIHSEQKQIIKWLLEKGAISTEHQLNDVICGKDIETLKILLGAGAKLQQQNFTKAIDHNNIQALEIFLEAGSKPSLAILVLAALNNKIEALKLFSMSDVLNTMSDALNVVIRANKTEAVKIFLKTGLKPNPDNLKTAIDGNNIPIISLLIDAGLEIDDFQLGNLFNKFKNEKDFSSLLRVLIDNFHRYSGIKFNTLQAEDSSLFLMELVKKNNLDLSFEDLISLLKIRRNLGHRFGIPLNKMDMGLGFELNISTEGNTNKNTNGPIKGFNDLITIDFEKTIEESTTLFFEKHSTLSQPSFERLLNDFYNTEKLNAERAASLIEKHQKGLTVAIPGLWPQHFVYMTLFKNFLCICNRGAYREEKSSAGIQFYLFNDSNKLTPELLLKIHTSPEFLLNAEGRKSLGLEEGVETFLKKEQPGGFCGWNNTKLQFRFLLALAQIPEDFKGTHQDLLSLLSTSFKETEKLYKSWSRFDRDHAINKSLEWYEQHPKILPDFDLLLFVLANHKGSSETFERLVSFLQKQNLTYEHFCIRDQNQKTIFHHVSNEENFGFLKQLISKLNTDDQKRIFSLLNSEDNQGTYPLDHIVRSSKGHLLVGEMISSGALFSFTVLYVFVAQDLLEVIKVWETLGIHFEEKDSRGKTALHYALIYNAKNILSYLISERSSLYFKSSIEIEEYIQLAKLLQNFDALKLLEEKQQSFK